MTFGGRTRVATTTIRERGAVIGGAALLPNALTESFDKADGADWGPDIVWSQGTGDEVTISNEGGGSDAGHAGSANALGRTPSLGATDLYCFVTLASLVNTTHRYGVELYLRAANLVGSQTFYAAAFQGKTGNTQSEVLFYKYVAGSFSNIGAATTITILAPGDLLRFEVSGTGLTAKINGSTVKTATDSSITTETRGGLFLGWNDTGNSVTVDNFEIGAL